jgi:hypothetical protein
MFEQTYVLTLIVIVQVSILTGVGSSFAFLGLFDNDTRTCYISSAVFGFIIGASLLAVQLYKFF